eukprot:14570427-Alexandrium_andersonii.AAC.1
MTCHLLSAHAALVSRLLGVRLRPHRSSLEACTGAGGHGRLRGVAGQCCAGHAGVSEARCLKRRWGATQKEGSSHAVG